jgi:predicted SAM-dependent methyltransferase
MIKLNLGCGENKLAGWENHDSDVDIRMSLPWPNEHADFILCEHCVEHIPQYDAIRFFQECQRVLKRGGVARIIVPSIEQILACNDPEYHKFAAKWRKSDPGPRSSAAAIIYAHGHQAAWTASLLGTLLNFAGFDKVKQLRPGISEHMALSGVDGHHKIIGARFNAIESCIFEGTAR